VTSRRRAAEEWAACGHAYARDLMPSSGDDARVAALLGRLVAGANAAGAPLFAGWRLLPEPDDAKALVMHRLDAMRELRGALHAAAVLTVGLTPHEAIAVRSPDMAAVFGWEEPLPDPAPLEDRWTLAEARTDRMLGRHFAVLTAGERDELVALVRSITA
jgi:hypothetical protein